MAFDPKRITKGRLALPSRTLVYSEPGLGKTMFACGAPEPLVIDADRGSHKFDVDRVVPESWEDVCSIVSEVEAGRIKCKSLVVDSITQVEFLLHRHLFQDATVSEAKGGYGRGDDAAVMTWRAFLSQLERLWMQGINIVLVAHAMVKKFEDPLGPGYDRFEVAARPKLAGLIRQWSDYVLFVRAETAIQPSGESKRPKAITTGVRWAHAKRSPAYDAKARGTNDFPEKFLLSWSEFDAAIRGDDARAAGMLEEVESMLVEIGDGKFAAVVRDYLKANPKMIVESRNRVAAKLEEVRAGAAPVVK